RRDSSTSRRPVEPPLRNQIVRDRRGDRPHSRLRRPLRTRRAPKRAITLLLVLPTQHHPVVVGSTLLLQDSVVKSSPGTTTTGVNRLGWSTSRPPWGVWPIRRRRAG